MQLNEKILLLEQKAYYATTVLDVLDFCSVATSALGVDNNVDRRIAAKIFIIHALAENKEPTEPLSADTKANMRCLIDLLKKFAPLEYDSTNIKRARIKAKRVYKRIKNIRKQMICPVWYKLSERHAYKRTMNMLADEQRIIQGHLKVLEELDTQKGGIPSVAMGKFERAIKLTSIKLNEL